MGGFASAGSKRNRPRRFGDGGGDWPVSDSANEAFVSLVRIGLNGLDFDHSLFG